MADRNADCGAGLELGSSRVCATKKKHAAKFASANGTKLNARLVRGSRAEISEGT